MMGRLRAMREPLKYVQGRDALLKFHEETAVTRPATIK